MPQNLTSEPTAKRRALMNYYSSKKAPPEFECFGYKNARIPKALKLNGALRMQIQNEPETLLGTELTRLKAQYFVPGHSEPIEMYFVLHQARKGTYVSQEVFCLDCSGHYSFSFGDYCRELFLCPAATIPTLFEAGGILEFVLLIAPPPLNKNSAWKTGADAALAEIARRYSPAIMLLKAYPMGLIANRTAQWGDRRKQALRRLYAQKLGVEDLNFEGFMWKPLKTNPMTWADFWGNEDENCIDCATKSDEDFLRLGIVADDSVDDDV